MIDLFHENIFLMLLNENHIEFFTEIFTVVVISQLGPQDVLLVYAGPSPQIDFSKKGKWVIFITRH